MRLGGGPSLLKAVAPPPDSAERRQLTVLFCDLVGSTALSARLDPEDYRALIAAYYREVSTQVQRFDGFVARRVGDGILVYFGYPAAHEDDAERAVRAGLALVEAVRRLEFRRDITLSVRIGIDSGLVVVDMIDGDAAHGWTAIGETPNLAARLQTLAEPGTVVIGPTARRLIGARLECRELGRHEIRGLAESVPVWQALRLVDPLQYALEPDVVRTPVIGRTDELDLLRRRWAQAKAGEGRVVLISGEAGIGKSRLARAFSQEIRNEPHLALRYFCSALHQDSALFPIISQIEQAADICREDSGQARLEKLMATLEPWSADPGQDVALLAELMGIDTGARAPVELAPAVRMQRTIAIFLSQLAWLAARQPVLMLLEDVHWIDPSSHEAVQQAIERLQTLPVLLIITGRPEFQPQWIGLPHVTVQTLSRLGRREAKMMIGHVIGQKLLPEVVTREIIARTDGVPLFVEELTRTVVESGLLRETADAYVLAGPLGSFDTPMTLQASLLTRLDRLGVAREIAQEAAAIGREFAYELLAMVSRLGEAEIVRGLDQLVASSLVWQRGMPPSASYSFRHALMQEVAYSTLLRSKREALHARIVEAYERQFRDLIDTRPELLAHHLAQAGCAKRSISIWLKAARVSMARGAVAEAVAHLRRGLALLTEVPDHETRQRQELELQITLGNALAAEAGYNGRDTRAAFSRARELCDGITDTAQLIRVTWGQFTGHFAGGRQKLALAAAHELLALSNHIEDPFGREMSHASVGASLLHRGSFTEARAQFERALAIGPVSERESIHLYGQSGRVVALAYLSLNMLVLDLPEAAQRLAEQAVKEAAELAHPTSRCFAHSVATRIYYLLGDRKGLSKHAAMVVRLADAHGLGLWQALGKIYTGWDRAEGGADLEGAALIRDGLAQYRAVDAALCLPLYLASLAKIEGTLGNCEAALELLDQAEATGMAGEEQWMSAELQRLAGEVILAGTGDTAAAEERFQAARALARQQGAALWERRAMMSLAALSLNERRTGAACDSSMEA